MDLKGGKPGALVGRRLTVKYQEDEGAPAVPYLGVVTWTEPGRLYACFDGFDEADGAWVDDSDEWGWSPAAQPAPDPPGAWTQGEPAPPIDKIFLSRECKAAAGAVPAAGVPPDAPPPARHDELLVKWKGLAHVHCQWVPRAALEAEHSNKQRVQRWVRAHSSGEAVENTWDLDGDDAAAGAKDDELGYNADFNLVERIVASKAADDAPPRFLVKWRGLPYASCTWEGPRTLLEEQRAILAWQAREQPPPPRELHVATTRYRPPRSAFVKLTESPVFKDGRRLRPYQLEGLNWLLFSWYARRSVMLADEMGLGKTIQSISTLHHLWTHEHVRGPFLVVAPLSTLAHWKREFDEWTEMNAVVYHGTAESREVLRTHEWRFADGGAAGSKDSNALYKFHALVTSYEVIKQDLSLLKAVPWRYMVIDEAHRLKNRESALAIDLRALRVEHMHLLSGTPLQNNTTELWALLTFLDPDLFPSLPAFLEEFGTLTDAAQVERLNTRIRPYLLRRQKNDVEKSLTPLEETIVWVEMTLFQKRTYRAILEGERELLVGGVTGAALPSLVNLQMELRKCCNHPYLIKGVEAHASDQLRAAEGEAASSDGGGAAAVNEFLAASGKCVLLDKLLPKLRREGHRVLIFSQMVRMLDILSDYLLERRYSHERLDGTIRGDLRQAAIDRFCRPDSDTFIFLLSTRAGGLGINLTAADTCILMDSDWNPQNDVQAMARSHRIGQTKRVKVFRLVTRNTYEAEMVERANRKLGLERAMNADRAADGLTDGRGGAKPAGPTQDRAEIDAMLKRGAYNIFMDDGGDGDARFKQFSEADIDEILESSSTKVTYGGEDSGSGSVFSKAAFIADDNELDMDDPEFWTKILPELEKKDPALAEYFLKRQTKQAEDGELDDDELDFLSRRGGRAYKSGRGRDDDDARRAVRRALAHVWSKTERMNCERALLSFGFGRWSRIKEAAQGGTKLRSEEEISQFGLAFLCLCTGVPVASVGFVSGVDDGASGAADDDLEPASAYGRMGWRADERPSAASAAEREGIAAAREVLREMGVAVPSLTRAQEEELEPLVSAGGAEYAERVHKLGASLLQRLLALKRLSDAIERHPSPFDTFEAPPAPGGVGRHPAVSWTPRDDALLLLGVYKHGFRAYEEVRDDPELPFSCLAGYAPLPPPLPQPSASGDGAGPTLQHADFDALDVLPLSPPPPPAAAEAARAAAAVATARPAGFEAEGGRPPRGVPAFLPEREFRERAKALMDAVGEAERRRDEAIARDEEWEVEWQRELRGEAPAAAAVPTAPRSGKWREWYACGVLESEHAAWSMFD